MKIPANFSIRAGTNSVIAEWDRPRNSGYAYQLVRYRDSVDDPSEVVRLALKDNELFDLEHRVRYIDTAVGNSVYFYTVCYLDPGTLLFPLKPYRVKVGGAPPSPLSKPTLHVLSQKNIAITWIAASEDIDKFEIYVESKPFGNVSGLIPKISVSADVRSYIYSLDYPMPAIYVAVVPASKDGRKILTASVTELVDPWRDIESRDPSISVAILPIGQEEGLPLFVDLSYGEPNSNYMITVGQAVAQETLMTDAHGHGQTTVAIPSGAGPGRRSVVADNGSGSIATAENALLIPLRLSPTPNDILHHDFGDLVSGYDNTVIERIRFEDTANDHSVSFKFTPTSSPQAVNFNVCETLAIIRTGGVTLDSNNQPFILNYPLDVLPIFVYPPFIYSAESGSLNFIGLVQQSKFVTASDWANHINRSHMTNGGVARVVKTVSEYDHVNQRFGSSLIDTGSSFVSDFNLTPGNAYWLEVVEPVSAYCLSGHGYASLLYPPVMHTNTGSQNALVIVAGTQYGDAETWANFINASHGGISRVVTSITPWNSSEQNYGTSLIDTGSAYEGNFSLTPGIGYIVEVKETVPNLFVAGQPLVTEVC